MPVKFWTNEPEEEQPIDDFINKQTLDPNGFKVGDWVVVLPEDQYYHNCEQGRAQQIVDIRKDSFLPYNLKFKNGSENTYHLVRAATEEEIEEAQCIPVTSSNRFIGMKVKPGRDWGKPGGVKNNYFEPKPTVGIIIGEHHTRGYEDWIRVTWEGDNSVGYYYRSGKRLGDYIYTEGYDLYVHKDNTDKP